VGFTATLDSGFLIGTGAFDVTTTSFTVDLDKVCCRPIRAYVSCRPSRDSAGTTALLHLYITLQARSAPPFSGSLLLQHSGGWGRRPVWLRGKLLFAIDRASRCRNQSWPWPPTPPSAPIKSLT